MSEHIYTLDELSNTILSILKKYNAESALLFGSYARNEATKNSDIDLLYNIGEHAYNLSDDFKSRYENIPWGKISGLRHSLVHDYENTNRKLICVILFDILPNFLLSLKELKQNDSALNG